MATGDFSYPPELPLRDVGERRVGLDLPPPIDARLDRLRQLAEGEGERTTRKELVAAILLAVPADGEVLAEYLKKYRKARVGDAAIDAPESADIITFERHGPGPRARRREH